MEPNKKIAVLGAGPMGLAVAYQLVRLGYQPVIYEADSCSGGMSASFDFDGLTIERYYHFHCTSDQPYFEILDELDLSNRFHWVETKMGYWFDNHLQSWGNPLALLRFKGVSFCAKIRYGLHAYYCKIKKNWKSLDRIEASDWIRKWVGHEAWQFFWQPLFEKKMYQFSRSFSAAWIWSRIHRIGNSRYNLFREKLGYLEGGCETLIKAMEKVIEENGGEIRLSEPVRHIKIVDGSVTGVETDRGFEDYGQVISTIPLPFIPKIIPDLPGDILDKIRKIDNIPVICIIIKLQKPLSENFWLNISDDTMDIPGIVEYSNLCPLECSVVYAPYYVPADHPIHKEDDEVLCSRIRDYFKRINPSLTDSDFLGFKVHRYTYAQPVCGPEFLEQLPPVRLPIRGLWLADTSYYYPHDRGISESIEYGRKIAQDAVSVHEQSTKVEN